MARVIKRASRKNSKRNKVRDKTRSFKRNAAQEVKPFNKKLSIYREALEKLETSAVNIKLLTAVTKACGPSIYKSNADVVSSSKKKELERVKTNFLIKRLGLKDSPILDQAINDVVEQFGVSHRRKYRAMFYYLLTKKLGVQERLLNPNISNSNEAFSSNLISFGKSFIEEQQDIDPEIMNALDEDFFALVK